MACGCRKGPTDNASSVGLMPSNQIADADTGLYPLGSWLECSRPYEGAYLSAKIYVVGRGTENEAMFTKGEKNAAIIYAHAKHTTIDRFEARHLCHDAVVEVLGA